MSAGSREKDSRKKFQPAKKKKRGDRNNKKRRSGGWDPTKKRRNFQGEKKSRKTSAFSSGRPALWVGPKVGLGEKKKKKTNKR